MRLIHYMLAATSMAFAPWTGYAGITYNFTSPVFEIGKTSTGASLDASFTFQLGGFTSGFTPSAVNLSNWLANFAIVGSGVPYTDEGSGLGEIFGSETLTTNTTPSTPGALAIGAQAYIWGFNTTIIGPTTEWILFTNPSWMFGDATTTPPPIAFDTSDLGTVAVVGFLSPSPGTAADPYMQTAAAPEPTTALLLGTGVLGLLSMRRRVSQGR